MTLCDDRFFFSTYIPEFQEICISLRSQTQECTAKSGSIHIRTDEVSTRSKNYCMTHSTVTSNLQVVNTVQYWICTGIPVCAWSLGECSNSVLETHISASVAEFLLFLNELCSARMEADKQDHTQHSFHAQVKMTHSINTTVPPTPQPSICLV